MLVTGPPRTVYERRRPQHFSPCTSSSKNRSKRPSAFEAPTTYTVEADSCGAHFVSTYTLREVAGTTTLRLEIRTQPNTFFAKLMSPLGLLMAGSMKKLMAKDNADIKRAAERLR